jgi:tetratricopeptide (TPR) repeat protein
MKRLLTIVAVVLACVSLAPAQGPQPKSQEEFDAVMAIQSAEDPNVRADAAKKLLTEFKNTDFKEFANFMLMISYQQLDDFENMMVYGERTLEINPENPGVLLQLAYAIPTRTREFDLDKEEKLTKAEDFASRALTLIPNLQKIDPNMPDEVWLDTKKEFMAQANESLGVIEAKRANYDQAAEFLTKAVGLQPQQNPMTHYHLADAYMNAGKKAEATTAINQSITLGGVPLGGGADAAQVLKQKIEAMP